MATNEPSATGFIPKEGDFLRGLEVKYGPVGLLGRFFLKADSQLRAHGISLSFATLSELAEINALNADSWRPLLPLFNDAFLKADPGTTFALFGRDRAGRVIATHAARLYNWTNTTFFDEAKSLRLFYDDPERMKLPGEALEITAPSTRSVSGLTVFSGAAWYHPDYRGRSLSHILPRIGKAYALTRWPAQTTVSFMAEEVHKRRLASVFGYDHVDWSVFMKNTRVGTLR